VNIFGINKYIKDRFNLKDDEIKKLTLLFVFSFFLGLFIAFYFVPANSEFVQYFGYKELPFAYILSGVVGYLASSLYSIIQKKRKSKFLFISALLIILSIAATSRLLLLFLDLNSSYVTDVQFEFIKKWLSFFVFIWAWPLISLVATITGGLSLRLLNLMQVKKYYGVINIGGVSAAILGYFTIPLILKIITHHYDLIFIGSFAIIAAILLIFKIYKLFPDKDLLTDSAEAQKQSFTENFKDFFKNKFILTIFVSASLSIIAIYIADYGFLVTIKNQNEIFKTQEDISFFMAIVFGGLKIGEFLISLISGRILGKGGLRVGLILLPISITVFVVLSYLSVSFFGVQSIAFLAFITLTKSSERIFRRGIDDPSFNVLYQTLPEHKKLYMQTRVGVVQQISIAIAGVVLLVIGEILTNNNGFQLQTYSLYVLPILLFWLFIATRLYKAYKDQIKHILRQKKIFQLEYEERDIFATDVLQKHILSEDINSAKFSVVILSETNPRSLEDYANFLLKIDDTIIRKSVLKNIDTTYSEKLVSVIENVGNKIGFKEKDLRKLILHSLYNLDYSEIKDVSKEELNLLIQSQEKRDIIFIAKYLYKNTIEGDEDLICKLLDYPDKAVKLSAIKIASKRDSDKLRKKLTTLLENTEYNNVIVSILIDIGDKILDNLEVYFQKHSSVSVLKKVIQIYAKIGTKKAEKLLISHIKYNDREIQAAIIYALYYSEFKADTESTIIIKQIVKEVVENILWIYVSIKDIVDEKNTLKLIQSLDLEREKSFELLFILLSFIHSPEIINLIKTNVKGENIIFSLEIIDNFIAQDIKQIIFPLFEKIKLSQKIKKLRPYFYHKEIGFKDRLNDILIKDYKKVDLWSKVKAIELIGKNLRKKLDKNNSDKSSEIIESPANWTEEEALNILNKINKEGLPDEVFVCLYHPSELVYSTAAKVIYDHSPVLCENYLNTLSPEKQSLIPLLKQNENLLLDNVKLLKRIYLFYTVPEKSLIKLASIIRPVKLKKDEYIQFSQDENMEDIVILIKGRLFFTDKSKTPYDFKRNDIIIKGLNVPQKATKLKVMKNSYVILINRFEYFNILVVDNELIQHLFNRMKF